VLFESVFAESDCATDRISQYFEDLAHCQPPDLDINALHFVEKSAVMSLIDLATSEQQPKKRESEKKQGLKKVTQQVGSGVANASPQHTRLAEFAKDGAQRGVMLSRCIWSPGSVSSCTLMNARGLISDGRYTPAYTSLRHKLFNVAEIFALIPKSESLRTYLEIPGKMYRTAHDFDLNGKAAEATTTFSFIIKCIDWMTKRSKFESTKDRGNVSGVSDIDLKKRFSEACEKAIENELEKLRDMWNLAAQVPPNDIDPVKHLFEQNNCEDAKSTNDVCKKMRDLEEQLKMVCVSAANCSPYLLEMKEKLSSLRKQQSFGAFV
jgi:hypothetical protein